MENNKHFRTLRCHLRLQRFFYSFHGNTLMEEKAGCELECYLTWHRLQFDDPLVELRKIATAKFKRLHMSTMLKTPDAETPIDYRDIHQSLEPRANPLWKGYLVDLRLIHDAPRSE
jgi:hypothetical protein